ncbi:MAG: TRAP transporter large permease [Dehalococcoidales bacterium]|nr:TRAP transporter large permease [Dehalococcoidales bacterium]
MTPVTIGLIGFFVMLVLILLGMNVAYALVALGFVGLVILNGFGPALSSMALISFEKATSYDFAVAPLFLLMSAFVSRGDIGKDAYMMARAWLGQIRGGLAIATTGACALFAACCGSSLACAVAMGKIAYPEMKRYGYDARMALGTIAAGGTMGILIPPSMGFILVGILTQQSIGKLFMAGILPGITQMLLYSITIYILCRFNPAMGPATPPTTFRQKMTSIKLTWPIITLFLLVIGGIYGGIFTPTEAGGIGAAGALAICLIKKQLTRASFFESLMEGGLLSAMMIALIIGAFIFNQYLAITRIPFLASEYIVSLAINKYFILMMVAILYLILGMVFDIYAILILTLPILFPTMTALGFDPIWYGVLMVRLVEIGLISPPFGMNLFGLAGSVNVPMGLIFRGVIPFLITDCVNIALLVSIPAIATFLPDIMLSQ